MKIASPRSSSLSHLSRALAITLALQVAPAFAQTTTSATAATGIESLQELQQQLAANIAALVQEQQIITQALQHAAGVSSSGNGKTASQNISRFAYQGHIFSETGGAWSRWNGGSWVAVTDTDTSKALNTASAQLCTGTGSANCIVTPGGGSPAGTAANGTGGSGATASTAPGVVTAIPSPHCPIFDGDPGARSSINDIKGAVSSSFTDSKGNAWTMSPVDTLLINGQPAGFSQDVSQAVKVNGTIYQQNALGYWWSWDGTTWTPSTSVPAIPAGSPTIASGLTQLTAFTTTDANGNSVTLQCGQLLVNGQLVSTGLVSLLPISGGSAGASTLPVTTTGGGTAANGTPAGSPGTATTSGGEVGNSNNGGTTDTSTASGNTGGGATGTGSTGTTGSSGPATGTGTGGTTTGTTSTATPPNTGTGTTTATSNATCAAGMSASGTMIPPAADITDAQGNQWSLAGGQPMISQNPVGALTGKATLLLEYNGNLYMRDKSNAWSLWNPGNTGWITLTADPRTAGTAISSTPVDGACGASNLKVATSAPTSNLCSGGVASVLSGSGPWSWFCPGSACGKVASCTTVPAGTTTGGFHVAGGQIIAPDGSVFIAKGIDVQDNADLPSAAQLKADFPGINFIRMASYNYDSPSSMSAYVNDVTSNGIVIEFTDYSNSTGEDIGGGAGNAYTGSQLDTENAWYSAMATTFANNPYVWFGTDNEPPSPGLAAWEQQTYNAVRSTGNRNPVLLEVWGGGVPGQMTAGLDPSVTASMTNVVWDVHFYGWMSNGSTDQATVNSTLAGMVSQIQTITSADGKVPVIIGEYGITTSATGDDPNGYQTVTGAQTSGLGTSAWVWDYGADNAITDGSGNLTAYGQTIARYFTGR